MHSIHLKIDDSIFDKFMGLLDILPKDKISISKEQNSISFEEAQSKVQRAINDISDESGIELDYAFEKAGILKGLEQVENRNIYSSEQLIEELNK